MITLILFFIDTKFKGDAGFIYLGTFLLDIASLDLIGIILQ